MDTPLFIAARFIIKHRPRADRLPNASRRGMYLLPAHNSLGYSEAKFLLRPPIYEVLRSCRNFNLGKLINFPSSSWDSFDDVCLWEKIIE